MKLSEITTSDSLILQLAARGYVKGNRARTEDQEVGIYNYRRLMSREHGWIHRLNVVPCVVDPAWDAGQAGFSALLNDQQEITDWCAYELYAGTEVPLDFCAELDEVIEAIKVYLQYAEGE